MNKEHVTDLVQSIPDNWLPEAFPNAKLPCTNLAGPNPHVARLHLVNSSVDIGWRAASIFGRHGQLFPTLNCSLQTPALFEAHMHVLRKGKDTSEELLEAMAMESHLGTCERAIVQALLILPDESFESVAEWTGMNLLALHCYEQLFFNVHDRLDEPNYVRRLVYPDGRFPHLLPCCEIQKEDFAAVLMRVAFEQGRDAMLELAGLGKPAATDLQRGIEQFTNASMTHALLLAHAGVLNESKPSASIRFARDMTLRATKDGLEDLSPPSPGESIGDALLAEMKRIKLGEVAARARQKFQDANLSD